MKAIGGIFLGKGDMDVQAPRSGSDVLQARADPQSDICLAMESDEAEQVGRFRELTPAQRAMLLSAHKYTEGLRLGAHFQALLCIIPPSLALASL